VIDGMDNFTTRFIMNSACIRQGIKFIYWGVHGFLGMTTTVIPGETPCLACLYAQRPEKEGYVPVLGAIPALIGNIQSVEALKLITGLKPSLAGRLLLFDGKSVEFSSYNIRKKTDCPVCDKEGSK
jgi:molybdopterin/thiamine biosynthesis adenylyltransferase